MRFKLPVSSLVTMNDKSLAETNSMSRGEICQVIYYKLVHTA